MKNLVRFIRDNDLIMWGVWVLAVVINGGWISYLIYLKHFV